MRLSREKPYIPTAYSAPMEAEALDKKTPLLRSMEALIKQALRIVSFGNDDVKYVADRWDREREHFFSYYKGNV